LAVLDRRDEVQDRGGDLGKPSPEVGEDLAEIVAAAAEHGEDRIADGSVEAFSISVLTLARSSPDGTSSSISSLRDTSLPGGVVSCSTMAYTIW